MINQINFLIETEYKIKHKIIDFNDELTPVTVKII